MAKRFGKNDPKVGSIIHDNISGDSVELVNRYIFKEQKWYVVMDDTGQYFLASQNVRRLND